MATGVYGTALQKTTAAQTITCLEPVEIYCYSYIKSAIEDQTLQLIRSHDNRPLH